MGAGPPGSDLDFAHLKAHPFFSGINFDTLDSTSPPIPADRYMRYFEELKAKKEVPSMDSALFQDMIRKNSANIGGPIGSESNGTPSLTSSASGD